MTVSCIDKFGPYMKHLHECARILNNVFVHEDCRRRMKTATVKVLIGLMKNSHKDYSVGFDTQWRSAATLTSLIADGQPLQPTGESRVSLLTSLTDTVSNWKAHCHPSWLDLTSIRSLIKPLQQCHTAEAYFLPIWTLKHMTGCAKCNKSKVCYLVATERDGCGTMYWETLISHISEMRKICDKMCPDQMSPKSEMVKKFFWLRKQNVDLITNVKNWRDGVKN